MPYRRTVFVRLSLVVPGVYVRSQSCRVWRWRIDFCFCSQNFGTLVVPSNGRIKIVDRRIKQHRRKQTTIVAAKQHRRESGRPKRFVPPRLKHGDHFTELECFGYSRTSFSR